MGHWNHRVIVKEYTHEDGYIEKFYAIHEVYYDKNNKPEGVTMEGIAIIGDSVEDLKKTLEQMKEACKLPVLNYDTDFKSEEDDDA